MLRIALAFIIQLSLLQSFSQAPEPYHPPLNIPLYLSGNFGEIRSDHFHSGIDIKTQGRIGHHVFAIEAGYVSRIKVQANGYGKSIYLAHPNGHTSVYGHLDKYREDVEAYVKQQQYRRKSHQLDLYLEPGEIKVEKGAFIAYSGNSGSSMGPHLHFEVRTTANQHPTNVLEYDFPIKDKIAPRFKGLYIYPLGEGARVNGSAERQFFELVIDQGIYTIPWGTHIEVEGEIGIGVEVYDYLDGAANRCGVYTLEGFVDQEAFYRLEMKEFAFSETRYVNAHIDYGEKVSSRKTIHRLYRLPNDRLRIYREIRNDGKLDLSNQEKHKIKVLASDVAGNISELSFDLQAKGSTANTLSRKEESTTPMKYNEASRFEKGPVTVEVPANALFEDINFSYSETPPTNGFLSPNYHIHSSQTALFKSYTLSVPAPELAPEYRDKLIFVTYDPEEEKISSAGGSYQNGKIEAKLRTFGEYAVSLDTIAPEIIPLKGSALKDQRGKKSLRFTIRDDLSGIEKYQGYLDNQWVLFEYDPKNDLLTHTFDKERITPGQDHELELYVSDSQGNVNLYHAIFTW